jgi:hypothetical protein
MWSSGRPFVGLVRGTAWVETGPDGRFRIRGLPPGAHALVFLVPGEFRSHGHEVLVPAGLRGKPIRAEVTASRGDVVELPLPDSR